MPVGITPAIASALPEDDAAAEPMTASPILSWTISAPPKPVALILTVPPTLMSPPPSATTAFEFTVKVIVWFFSFRL